MPKDRGLIITHDVKTKGFDEPILPPKLIRRGLRRAGVVIEEEVEGIIETQHHDTGQLENSVHQNPVDMKNMKVVVRFKGKRKEVHHRRRKDGSKGPQYRRYNKTVARFLNKQKQFYDRNEQKIADKASAGFTQEIAKKK